MSDGAAVMQNCVINFTNFATIMACICCYKIFLLKRDMMIIIINDYNQYCLLFKNHTNNNDSEATKSTCIVYEKVNIKLHFRISTYNSRSDFIYTASQEQFGIFDRDKVLFSTFDNPFKALHEHAKLKLQLESIDIQCNE